jgi:hypothetical protein
MTSTSPRNTRAAKAGAPADGIVTTSTDSKNGTSTATSTATTTTYTGINIDAEHLEFGGSLGAGALIVWSHYILLYFWYVHTFHSCGRLLPYLLFRYCYETHMGQMVIPHSVDDLKSHLHRFADVFMAKGIPSKYTWVCYFGFFIVQLGK